MPIAYWRTMWHCTVSERKFALRQRTCHLHGFCFTAGSRWSAVVTHHFVSDCQMRYRCGQCILKVGPEDSGFLNWKKLPKYLILTTYLLVSLLSQFIWGHYRFKSVYQLVVDSFVKYTLKLESLSKLVLAHLLCTGTLLIRTYPLVPSPLL